MSIIGLPDPEKVYKKSHHRKNDSEELDVFEAAKYFAGANEMYASYAINGGTNFAQKAIGKDHHHRLQEKQGSTRAGRFSLDMPTAMRSSIPSQNINLALEKQIMVKEKKKHKQPSSPGGKLAHFLNSLFSPTSSRKKKAKSTTAAQSAKDEDHQSPGWRRKRRSSISHFQMSTATAVLESKSVYSHSGSGSGFRTPPPFSYTPTKSYKDPRSYSDPDHPHTISFPTKNHVKSVADKKHNLDYAWLDDKFKFVDHQSLQSCKNGNRGVSEKTQAHHNWADRYLSDEKELFGSEFNDADDGADSDSSSDLFELPNYDLDCYNSGLPVYETTNMDSIKRSAPITSAAR